MAGCVELDLDRTGNNVGWNLSHQECTAYEEVIPGHTIEKIEELESTALTSIVS